MRVQDKEAEILASQIIPTDKWLDDPKTYRAKRKHLGLLGLLEEESPKGALILDAGCGPGTYGIILAEEGFRVIGGDIVQKAIEKAKERVTNKRVDFTPILGDLENLAFKGNSFDAIFAGWTLHHLPDLAPAVKEFYRILKPGGKVFLVEPNETNLAMRISRSIEALLSRLVLKAGWDTPNRTSHSVKDYLRFLKQVGFTEIQFSSCYSGLPPMPAKTSSMLSRIFLLLSYHLRNALFTLSSYILPRPLNGADLLITCRKGGE